LGLSIWCINFAFSPCWGFLIPLVVASRWCATALGWWAIWWSWFYSTLVCPYLSQTPNSVPL
jgi:hypothetical protein